VVKFNFQGGKNQFPRLGCPKTNFTANTNQSNESVTVVKINIQSGTNQLFFSPATTVHFRASYACTGGNWFLLRWLKLIFTTVQQFLPRWEIVLISSWQVQSLLKYHPALIFTM